MLCIEITHFNKLTQIKPNGEPVDIQDVIKNQNILTRFASEFDMMSEMIQFQKGVNQVILGVNNFLGEGPPQNVDRIGAAVGSSSSSSSSTSTVGKFLTHKFGGFGLFRHLPFWHKMFWNMYIFSLCKVIWPKHIYNPSTAMRFPAMFTFQLDKTTR